MVHVVRLVVAVVDVVHVREVDGTGRAHGAGAGTGAIAHKVVAGQRLRSCRVLLFKVGGQLKEARKIQWLLVIAANLMIVTLHLRIW